MHDRWEYKILTARAGKPLKDEGGSEYGQFSEAGLTTLGRNGWEVCGYDWSTLNVHTLIVKRKVRTPSQGS
jgi:hypothetical protein